LVAGGVGEEVQDFDVVGAGEFGEIFADGILEGELALLLQDEDRGRGELLGDAADGVSHGGFGGDGRGDAREAEGVGVNDVVILDDADGGGGNAGVGENLLGDGGDLGGGVGGELLGLRGEGDGGEEGGGEESGGEEQAHDRKGSIWLPRMRAWRAVC
jgi:hypothetical protein